jgi:hypothetical protein
MQNDFSGVLLFLFGDANCQLVSIDITVQIRRAMPLMSDPRRAPVFRLK